MKRENKMIMWGWERKLSQSSCINIISHNKGDRLCKKKWINNTLFNNNFTIKWNSIHIDLISILTLLGWASSQFGFHIIWKLVFFLQGNIWWIHHSTHSTFQMESTFPSSLLILFYAWCECKLHSKYRMSGWKA